MQVTATEVGRGSVLNQLVNQSTSSTNKWFVLFDNALDGTYYPLSSDGSGEIGWWGTTLSDASGFIATSPTVEVAFDGLQPIHTIQVAGNPNTGCFPVDFTISLYNDTTLLRSKNIVGNDKLICKVPFSQVYEVTRISITITKINVVGQPAQLMEFINVYEVVRSDNLVISCTADVTAGISITSADTLRIVPQDVSDDVIAQVSSSDALSVASSDSSFFTQYHFNSTDSLVLGGNEITSVRLTNILKRTDQLIVEDGYVKNHVVSFTKVDSLRINPNIEIDDITVDFRSTDILTVFAAEMPIMTNVHTVANSPSRQIFAKVEINYTDPFTDQTMQYVASETGRFTSADKLADNVDEPKYKWFSLHDNKLDGTYHPIAANGLYSVGWWGTHLSDAQGYLSVPPVITITFAPRALTNLRVVGDSKLNCYPVDFELRAYDSNDTLLHTEVVTNNTSVDWIKWLDPFIPNVVKIEVIITRISRANSVVKLMELLTSIKETYLSDQIESIRLLEEVGYNTGSLPIGNLSANEIDVSLSNADRRFDLNNSQSPLYGYIKRNRRVTAWLGANINETIEWHLLGVFWTTSWDISKDSLVAKLTARDRLELLRQTDFETSIVYENKTLYELFEIVLQDAGLSADEYELDSALTTIVIPYAWFPKMSHRAALQRLASCGIIQVYCTKEGKIRVNLNFDAEATPIVTYDENVNVYTTRYPLAVTEQVNYIEVTSKHWQIGSTEPLYEANENLTLGPNSTLIKIYEFNSVPVYSIDAPIITADPGVVVDNYTLYAWGVQITYKNNNATNATLTSVTINGRVLKEAGRQTFVAKDDHLISEDGKIKQSVEHDFIQDAQYAQQLATTILDTYKSGRRDVTLFNRGDLVVHVGDRVDVVDTEQQVVVPYVVTRQNIEWVGYLDVTTEGKIL